MRAFAAMLLSTILVASPAFAANDASNSGKEDPRLETASATAPAAAKTENSVIENQLLDLRNLIETQTQELESQRATLKAQQLKMEALEEKLRSSAAPESAATLSMPATLEAAKLPAIGTGLSAHPAVAAQAGGDEVSPLQFKIGSAYITPVGFMDFTGEWRNHDGGSGIGTNFASIPYGNSTIQNHLGEFRFSMQNSRIGFRVDAMVKGAHVIGYMESDYLGNNPGNVAVSSNSNTLRSRLYWVDVQKDKWEILGGQTWSLITPGRTGISPLPGNLFFTQNIDVNYQLGLVWGRIPEVRFVYHPSKKVAFAVALDSPEQYIGGSAGGSGITLPTLLNSAYGATEFNNGGNTLNVPNVAPDVIAKLAFDPSSKFHVEVGGVERQFRAWNPNNNTHYSATGGGAFVNLNVEVFKGFRLVTNNFWSDGGGRYIFGQAPDVIALADGSIHGIHAGSTVSGFEFTHKNTMFYGYYGALYVQRNTAFDANGTTPIGYGYSGSPSSQNRAIQEGTVGFNQTLWRDGKYGALNFMGQYSYVVRNPWDVAITPTVQPEDAHLSMAFINLRYTLPGSAPTIK
jgi:hypothetical protein